MALLEREATVMTTEQYIYQADSALIARRPHAGCMVLEHDRVKARESNITQIENAQNEWVSFTTETKIRPRIENNF